MEYDELIEFLNHYGYIEYFWNYINALMELAKNSDIFIKPKSWIYLYSPELSEGWTQFIQNIYNITDTNFDTTIDIEELENTIRLILQQECNKIAEFYSQSIFYPIGQGLMNATFLNTGLSFDADFNANHGTAEIKREDFFSVHVYDCGSGLSPTISDDKNSILDDFYCTLKTYCDTYFIDYLYISHFDTDHINGIGKLLQICNCKNIIITYTPPLCILSNLYKMISESDENNETINEYRYHQMMFPVETLIELAGIQNNDINIIQLDSTDSLKQNVFLENFSSQAAASIGALSHALVIKSQQSYHITNNFNSNTVHVYHAYPKSTIKMDNNDYLNNIYFDEHNWKYMISYYVPNGKTIDELSIKFAALLHEHWNDIPLDYEQTLWRERILFHLQSPDDRAYFKKIYKQFSSDINRLSLCVSIAPKETTQISSEELSAQNHFNDKLHIYENTIHQSGTLLLTGDAVLHAKFSGGITYYNSIINALNANNFPPIQTILLPHHGSDKNINNETFNALSQTAKQWVVSYGKNNSYVHPCAPPCTWIGTHICVQCNIHPKKNTFPEEASEDIKDIIIPKPDTAAEDIVEPINDITLYHCHDSSKVTVFIHHELYRQIFFK